MAVYDDDDDGRRRPGVVWIAVLAGLLVVAGLAWLVVRSGEGEDVGTDVAIGGSTTASIRETTVDATSDVTGGADTTRTTEPTPTEPTAPLESSTAASTTAAVTTSALPPETTTAPASSASSSPYETLPDGSPAPVIALFGASSITATGAVPSQEAKDRLEALAIQYAKPGQGTIDNQLTINPAVPLNVGVRVVELTSVRFPAASAEVLPEHALELDRVAAIMGALPNITALVIGHADQRGDELSNFAISEQRADAVVNYLAAKGIAPSRLASRAVGEADLLTLDDDAAALELNRRTELVFYGLLLG